MWAAVQKDWTKCAQGGDRGRAMRIVANAIESERHRDADMALDGP